MAAETLHPYFERMLSGQSFRAGEDMKYELIRLKTFSNWPENCPVSSIRLSQAGFYSTGNGDEVVCFSCDVRKQNWQLVDFPLAVHRRLKPDCPFLNGDNSENVPIASTTGSGYINPLASISSSSSFTFDNVMQGQHRQSHLSYHPHGDTDNTVCDQRTAGVRTEASPAVVTGLNISHARLEEIGSLRYEQRRLETFRNWPLSVPVSPADVAHSGMYYTGSGDRCQCVYCKGEIRNWEPGDVPRIEHGHHFPRCPFILGLNVGNIPMASSQSEASSDSSVTNDTLATSSKRRMEALGVNTDQPRHPNYAVEAARISSYQNWSRNKDQTPVLLAKCGFFFAGFGDNVKCFFCDGGLRNWETGDDPWVEHARWFPRCAFVRQCKGEDFIRDVQNVVEEKRRELASNAADTDYSTPNAENTEHHIEDREVLARMNTPAVLAVSEMGFNLDLVKKAIMKRLISTSDDFQNAASLVEAIFAIETEQAEREGPGRRNQAAVNNDGSHVGVKNGGGANCEDVEAMSEDSNEDDNQLSAEGQGSTIQNADEAVYLLEENRQLKEQRLCKVCLDYDANVVFLPCGHLVCCPGCASAVTKCPICRKTIKGSVRTFIS